MVYAHARYLTLAEWLNHYDPFGIAYFGRKLTAAVWAETFATADEEF